MGSSKPSLADIYLGLVSGPAMVLQQESRAQAELCKGGTFPRNIRGIGSQTAEEAKKVLLGWGFVFEDQLPENHGIEGSDDLFQVVIMPPGWKIEPTSHSMWSNLADPRGLIRGTMFYKGAFYDRDAFFNLSRRFRSGYKMDDWSDRGSPSIPIIEDGNRIVWRGAPIPEQEFKPGLYMVKNDDGEEVEQDCPDCGPSWQEKTASCETCGAVPFASHVARHIASQTLLKHYPDADNPMAYWDLESPEFPEWGSQEREGSRYNYYVSIYRNGSLVDSACNSIIQSKTLEDASAEAQKKAGGFSSSYDQVRWRLMLVDDDGREIREADRGTWDRPKPKLRRIKSRLGGSLAGDKFYEDGRGNVIYGDYEDDEFDDCEF